MKRRELVAATGAAWGLGLSPGWAAAAKAKGADARTVGPFDVVVIGGGAAGAALAYRLSSNRETKVLLLEAGPDERPPEVVVPARWPQTLAGRLNYGYSTVPQASAAGRVIGAPRGRVLGGTTCLNAMIFSFPRADDLAQWGPLWSHAELMPAMHAMESHRRRSRGRGTAGPVRNGPVRQQHPLCADFVTAAVQAGHPACDDMNSQGAHGVGWFDLSIDDKGERLDAAQSYIRPVRRRRNLQVWTDCTVTRMEFSGNRVTALRLRRQGEEQLLPVAGEVVLSAGAIDSPALLLRSGVGARSDLEALGLRCVVDLPAVGRNLQDHPAFPVVWSTDRTIGPPANQFSESCLYLPHEAQAGGRTVSIAFTHIALSPAGSAPLANGATALVGLYEVTSRGQLKLNPANIDGPPLIDPGYLSDERDVESLVGAISIARNVGQQAALAGYRLKEVTPGADATDAPALRQAVRQGAVSYGHLSCTCAMGDDGVVDQRLRVRGTGNLRVADASVFPAVPTVAPSVTAQLVGWRGAELIAEDLRSRKKAAARE